MNPRSCYQNILKVSTPYIVPVHENEHNILILQYF